VPTREGAAEITEDRIRAHIKARAEEGLISAWAVPEHVHIVQAIEKTSVGKIDKKQLRERYG
jgi:fatty-acyl-CoA synthase